MLILAYLLSHLVAFPVADQGFTAPVGSGIIIEGGAFLNIYGTSQNDRIELKPGDGNTIIVRMNGKNHIISPQPRYITVFAGVGRDFVVNDFIAPLPINPGYSSPRITLRGGPGIDRLHDRAGVCRLLGEGGDDLLISSSPFAVDGENPKMEGGAGNDTLYGGGGGVTMVGDGGADMIFAGAGDDNINGGVGNDIIVAGPGNDWINGGSGSDIIFGGSGDDYMLDSPDRFGGPVPVTNFFYGGPGDDEIFGADGDNVIYAGSGNDEVTCSFGDDDVFGGEGDDDLFGLSGDDYMSGGAGDDHLDGGSGANKLYGNLGADTFSSNHADLVRQ